MAGVYIEKKPVLALDLSSLNLLLGGAWLLMVVPNSRRLMCTGYQRCSVRFSVKSGRGVEMSAILPEFYTNKILRKLRFIIYSNKCSEICVRTCHQYYARLHANQRLRVMTFQPTILTFNLAFILMICSIIFIYEK